MKVVRVISGRQKQPLISGEIQSIEANRGGGLTVRVGAVATQPVEIAFTKDDLTKFLAHAHEHHLGIAVFKPEAEPS